MKDLSKNLKGELFFLINSKVIKEISWIETNFSETMINSLIFQIKDKSLNPEEEIGTEIN